MSERAKRNTLVDSLDIFRLERRLPDDECIENDTDRPSIYLETMSVRYIEQHFRCNIIRRPTYRLLPLARILDQRRKPKVSHLNIHVTVKEEIAELQVTVDHLVLVHVVTGTNQLDHEEARFGLGEFTSAAEHVHEGAGSTEAEGHIDVRIVFEALIKFDDVGVLKGAVNLDFGVKLLNTKT